MDISLHHRFAIGQFVDMSGDVISHLNISHVRPDDGGLYKCIATNSMGAVAHSARLNVYGRYQYQASLTTWLKEKELIRFSTCFSVDVNQEATSWGRKSCLEIISFFQWNDYVEEKIFENDLLNHKV